MAEEGKTARPSILVTVAQTLADKGGELVQNKVVDALVDKEVDKRASAVQKVLELLEQEERNLKKVDRPDVIVYDRNRKPVAENFSKARLDELEKINKKISKITNALNKALEKADYSEVYNLQSGKLEDDKPAEVKSED